MTLVIAFLFGISLVVNLAQLFMIRKKNERIEQLLFLYTNQRIINKE